MQFKKDYLGKFSSVRLLSYVCPKSINENFHVIIKFKQEPYAFHGHNYHRKIEDIFKFTFALEILVLNRTISSKILVKFDENFSVALFSTKKLARYSAPSKLPCTVGEVSIQDVILEKSQNLP